MIKRKKIIKKILNKFLIHFVNNDELFLKLQYKLELNKRLNLKEPKTFNEKLQWLKLNNKNEKYSKLVDKYEVKKYISNIIGKEYIVPTIGIYESFDDITFSSLPEKFVIKCTHNSGGVFIIKNKQAINYSDLRKKINKMLKQNFYKMNREWPYKKVKPRIIVEKYLDDISSEDINDYKIFCFNGKPKIVLVCSERFSSDNMCETWFDNNWRILNIIEGKHPIDVNQRKPKNFNKMIELAQTLANGFPFIRVDFYNINGKILFGELTFYPASGYEKFEPESWDLKLGKMLDISKIKKEKKNEK